MEKHVLQLVALTNSESHPGQYTMVLESEERQRRLTVTIGASEAQSIAMVVEMMKPKRPQTHDLLANTIRALGGTLAEVNINAVVDNCYYAQLIIEQDEATHVLDTRVSDAVALALRQDCPVYTYGDILEQTGFSIDQQGLPKEQRGSFVNYPLEMLEDLLKKVLKKEDYQSATRIRDAIRQKKGGAIT